MTLVREFELAAKTKSELQGLLRDAFNRLANSAQGSPERKAALGTIESIRREFQSRSRPAPGRKKS